MTAIIFNYYYAIISSRPCHIIHGECGCRKVIKVNDFTTEEKNPRRGREYRVMLSFHAIEAQCIKCRGLQCWCAEITGMLLTFVQRQECF